ncbi:23S rRNA (guanosine(2251)-2'-O)-methyltransferase RlmB [Methylobacterium currus]|uniref:23S rRNA (Guanosine(2251)-2'-O)-methyltransferase RlmB n=1 Tax=Methylobacterium currus TaxID=2051553 RepID=A0A2R4WFI7_9HYPH|nr:23S rRNA (guanosine(2251)-2'-O)-methyltransferase RlmB [Methylobacterium currus]AWB20307.1 23S rRNA (guanosine(2251)-2'-O)-methyltransferase RlmB [Methylobacterium currus]UHC14945.1 23S rRNA (guanosine(2251)-2'-O)-methyltransferase RlmB [Methylobacterium currus]
MTTRQAPRGGGWKGGQGQGKGGFGRGGPGKGGGGRRFGGEEREDREGLTVLYGWHPVSEALRNPKRDIRRLLATENAALRLAEEVGELRITPEIVKPGAITGLLGPDAVHQGLYLEAEPLAGPAFDALPDDAVLLALDQITDPHNVGAIVRTAAAFGVTAIVTTARHSPTVTGVLAKSASGGLEHVPFVVVRNLAEALIELGERGFTRVGLDSEAPETLDAVGPKAPLVVVLGAEGKGLRQRTRECCDVMARIPFRGAIQSLNVSNAAAITLYALMPRA